MPDSAAGKRRWRLSDIPWDRFELSKVDPDLLKVVKAASLVEYNAGDYAIYLCNVFGDDAAFQAAARIWAQEETQHGRALGHWAALADPSFDLEASFKRFAEGYRLPLDAARSVRGTRVGELVARCVVEVGTSSYYSALGAATDEPVLKEICARIAADEFRHYKLFYGHLQRYLETEPLGKLRRLLVVLGRIGESEDDELAFAYYAANGTAGEPYDRKRWSRAYGVRAFGYFRPEHIRRGVAMSFKAAGLNPRGAPSRWAARGAYWLLRARRRRFVARDA